MGRPRFLPSAGVLPLAAAAPSAGVAALAFLGSCASPSAGAGAALLPTCTKLLQTRGNTSSKMCCTQCDWVPVYSQFIVSLECFATNMHGSGKALKQSVTAKAYDHRTSHSPLKVAHKALMPESRPNDFSLQHVCQMLTHQSRVFSVSF